MQKWSSRFREKMTLEVLIQSNLPYFIQMKFVLGSYHYELYLTNERMLNVFLLGKQKWIMIKACLFHD